MRPFAWLSLFFFALYFVYGAYVPFWSLWLASVGVSPEQIGLLIGLGLAVRFPGNLAIMGQVRHARQLLPLGRVLAILSLLSFALFYLTHSFWPLLLLMLLANFIYPTLLPMSDALASRMIVQVNLDYGKVRLWGSAAFIVGSSLVGAIIGWGGAQWVLHVMLLGLLLLCVLSWLPLSPMPEESPGQPRRGNLLGLLKQASFRRFLLIMCLLQGSHAAYYGFSAIHWKANGYSEGTIGYLWGLGVLAEIGMFALDKRLLRRLSPRQMLLLGAGGGLVRWVTLGLTTSLPLLAGAQLLHSLTFCVSHLAAIRYLTQQLPREQLIAGQTLYAALAQGMFTAVLTALVGACYPSLGSQVFLLMAALVMPVLFLRLKPFVPA